MRTTLIEAKTLPEAWFLCVFRLLGGYSEERFNLSAVNGIHKYTIDRGSFEGQQRLEFDGVTVHIEHPGSRPLVPDTPQGVPPPSTMEYVESYLPYLMCSAKKANEEYTYGEYLEPQIAEVIKMYKDGKHNTNQAAMTIGGRESIHQKDPPCLRLIDTRVLDSTLHFFVYFRSWDLWAGFPSNLAAIQLLKEYMSSEIGIRDGEIIAYSKGLHLYDYQWDLAKALLRR